MATGLYVKGTAGNLILGDGYPTLCIPQYGELNYELYAGRAYVPVGGRPTWVARTLMRLRIQVVFPTVVTSAAPPLVFAIAGYGAQGCFNSFLMTGSPGAWTGFSVAYRRTWNSNTSDDYGTPGFYPTGWKWALGAFSDVSPASGFGLRIMGADGATVFDSRWRLGFFRGLLTNWVPSTTAVLSVRGVKSIRTIDQFYYHAVDRKPGQSGFALNQLGSWDEYADTGDHTEVVTSKVELGVIATGNLDRFDIKVYYPSLDHYGPNPSPLNAFRILWVELRKPL